MQSSHTSKPGYQETVSGVEKRVRVNTSGELGATAIMSCSKT